MSKNKYIAMSATRVSAFLSCRWKYWCQYVIKRPRKPNPAFKLGTTCHEALELAGRIWQKKEKFTKADIQKIRKKYRESAAKEGIENMVIYEAGLNMVTSRLDSFGVGRIIDIENKFDIATNDGVKIIGAMDRVSELDEDTILITDYKTSKYVYTDAELKEDIQLSMYDLVASLYYPQYKRIVLSLDYLRTDPVYTYRTYRDRQLFSKYLLSLYEEMMTFKEKDAIPMLNDMCNWCDHNDSCPAYIAAASSAGVFNKALNTMTDEELVAEYSAIKSRKRVVDEHESKLKSFITSKINNNHTDVEGEGSLLYIRQNKRTTYNARTLYRTMPLNDFLSSVSVNNSSVSDFMIHNPEEKEKINETASVSHTRPFLAQRKIKKVKKAKKEK